MKPDFWYDESSPLDRFRGESKRAHVALLDYVQMGGGRSLRVLLEHYRQQKAAGKTPPCDRWFTISCWSRTHKWVERAELADRMRRQADERQWADRRAEIRETDFADARRLRALASEILDNAPKFIKQTKKFIPGHDGSPDREIITVALDANLAIRAIEAASKLARLAAEMETEHQTQDVVIGQSMEDVRRKRWEAVAEIMKSIGEDEDAADENDTEETQ